MSGGGWWATVVRFLESEWQKLTYVPNESARRGYDQRQHPGRPTRSRNFTLADRLIESWSREGWEGNSPASNEAIEAFEEKYGARLPLRIRDYLRQVNGTGRGDLSSEVPFRFWSIEDMATVQEACGLSWYEGEPADIVFASQSILDFYYTFRLGEKDPSISITSVWTERSPGRMERYSATIAKNFDDFVSKFVRDPRSTIC